MRGKYPPDVSSFDRIMASLLDCLQWCDSFRDDVPRPVDDCALVEGYSGCEGWTALLEHHGTVASIARSTLIAESALRFLPEHSRDCYATRYPVVPIPGLESESGDTFTEFALARRRLIAARSDRRRLSEDEVEFELRRSQALLVTDWQMGLGSGSGLASKGFLDLDDIPPWDTWLGLVDVPESGYGTNRCLLSWVPWWAAELVDEAVYVNAYGCLAWGHASEEGITVRRWGERWNGEIHPDNVPKYQGR